MSESKPRRKRRSPEEMIADLELEIARQKERAERLKKVEDPVLKEIPKLKKRLQKFVQVSFDGGRQDIANSVSAFIASLDRYHGAG